MLTELAPGLWEYNPSLRGLCTTLSHRPALFSPVANLSSGGKDTLHTAFAFL
jgi:hypothetical protein